MAVACAIVGRVLIFAVKAQYKYRNRIIFDDFAYYIQCDHLELSNVNPSAFNHFVCFDLLYGMPMVRIMGGFVLCDQTIFKSTGWSKKVAPIYIYNYHNGCSKMTYATTYSAILL